MNNSDTLTFIEQALTKIAKDHDSGIPENAIPQIVQLLADYPDFSIRGSRTKLKQGLEKIISNLQAEGKLN